MVNTVNEKEWIKKKHKIFMILCLYIFLKRKRSNLFFLFPFTFLDFFNVFPVFELFVLDIFV